MSDQINVIAHAVESLGRNGDGKEAPAPLMKTIPMRRARRMKEHGRGGMDAFPIPDAADIRALHDEAEMSVFVRVLANFTICYVKDLAEAESVGLDLPAQLSDKTAEWK